MPARVSISVYPRACQHGWTIRILAFAFLEYREFLPENRRETKQTRRFAPAEECTVEGGDDERHRHVDRRARPGKLSRKGCERRFDSNGFDRIRGRVSLRARPREKCSHATRMQRWESVASPSDRPKGGHMQTSDKTRIHLILVKPSHYDDQGCVIQWARSAVAELQRSAPERIPAGVHRATEYAFDQHHPIDAAIMLFTSISPRLSRRASAIVNLPSRAGVVSGLPTSRGLSGARRVSSG